MRSKLMSAFIAFSILLSSSFVAPKGDAAVGLIFRKKIAAVIGGIQLASGAVLVVTGAGAASAHTATTGGAIATAIAGTFFTTLGFIVGGIGLVVLDDQETVVDFEFTRLTKENMQGLSSHALSVYNSELEELNAIRKSIMAEMKAQDSAEEARDLWIQYSGVLSAETRAIAEIQAKNFMN